MLLDLISVWLNCVCLIIVSVCVLCVCVCVCVCVYVHAHAHACASQTRFMVLEPSQQHIANKVNNIW